MSAVVTFYRFVPLTELEPLRESLEARAAALGLCGTVLLAAEGINGTLAGTRPALDALVAWLEARAPFAGLACRYSEASEGNPVFHRLKVRIRSEIVNLGRPEVAPASGTGTHVDARRFNELLDDPTVVVVDTRNDYEVVVGSFPGAINPGTRTFREFPRFVAQRLDPERTPRIAMFCTGGVRCEKASAYLLDQGFEEVYQLDGGILSYLEQVAPADNRWRGECFVFDQRVAVDDNLSQGSHRQCFACRRALGEDDVRSPHYVEGVSCHHCFHEHTPRQRAAFRERARQEALAGRRGARHVGQRLPAQQGGASESGLETRPDAPEGRT